MKKNTWNYVGPALLVIVILFIIASYFYDRKFHRTVVEHRPEPSDVPGGNAFGGDLMASEEGKTYLRFWETKARRFKGAQYDLEIILNDDQFFRALSDFEGKGVAENKIEIYKSYQKRYQFDRKLVFTVMMHSAMGNLFDLRPEKWMFLMVNGKEEYQPEDWRESNRSMEFHREAVVTFSRKGGTSIFSPGVETVELYLRDPAKKPATVLLLRWDFEKHNLK